MENLGKMFVPTPDSLRGLFVNWYNEHVADFDVPKIQRDECYVMWFCFVVGNAKALISTSRPDHTYYEVTYNVSRGAVYFDQYIKLSHTELIEKNDASSVYFLDADPVAVIR